MEISPMLLSEEEYKPGVFNNNYPGWIAQEKANGTRALIHVKDGIIVGIRNRNNAPVMFIYKELKSLPTGISEGILDAEIVVLRDGKSVYYNGVDHRRSEPSPKTLVDYPVSIIVFDAIIINKELLINKPYSYRYQKIVENVKESDKLIIAKNYDNPEELWNKVIEDNREGLVLKNPAAAYELGSRSKNNLKFKFYKWCEVVVEKTEQNSKGTKITGKTVINGQEIIVEAQIQSQEVGIGETKKIRYLDIYGNKLIQPTRG